MYIAILSDNYITNQTVNMNSRYHNSKVYSIFSHHLYHSISSMQTSQKPPLLRLI